MKFFTFLLSVITFMCCSQAQQAPLRKIVLKVNLGGGPVGDFLGEDQVLETEGFHKTVTKDRIENTDKKEIFQSQRFARDEDFVLRIPVPDGIYSVTLLFAETYKKACIPGGRVFDISLGTPVSGVTKIFEGFDLFQAAGCAAAHGKRFDKVPAKEGIVVHLGKKTQHPSLAGFVVEGYPAPKGDGSEYHSVGQPPSDAATDGGTSQAMPGATSMNGQNVGTDLGGTAGILPEGQQPELLLPGRTPPGVALSPETPSMRTAPMLNTPAAGLGGVAEAVERTTGLPSSAMGSETLQHQESVQIAPENQVHITGQSQVTVRRGGLPVQNQLQAPANARQIR